MESPAFEPTKSDVRVGNGVSSNACPTEYEDTPTSPSSVGDANSDLSDDTSPTASVATPVTDNSIDKVTLMDQVESSGVTSTGDIALSDPEVTEKIVLLWNMPTSVSTVGHGIPSDGAGEEVSPQDPSGDMVELDIELDEDVVASAENARLVRSGPGIMSKAERVTKHKEEMRRQAHVQVEVGEALGDNILAEPLTKPDYYRRSTNPRRINGVYYHGHPRVVRGWLANLPFAPYSAPVPRRGLVWQDQLDPLDLPSEHPDNAEINNEATSVGPAPNASSSQSGPGWWNVPAMLQKAGAALRVF
ncbi:hypothetical protein FRC02_004262 [Tulasnella sp. 418]|nr:hypothetical protein FRC02_004262 [Tulasnella sp. 418]